MNETHKFLIQSDRSSLDEEMMEATDNFEAGEISGLDNHQVDATRPGMIEAVGLVITASVSVMAYKLFNHWLRKRELGVQIDARTKPATISNIANVPSGFVVIIDQDGKITTVKSDNVDIKGFTSMISGVIG